MYLRLKPCAIAPVPKRHLERPTCDYKLSHELYEQLTVRNLEGFDWINGGQRGPIKFIDLHQLEFAVRRAHEGSFVATMMVNLVLKGVTNLCVPKHGGACEYSTGLYWNARNRLFTLSGQAITLQALALGATLRRRSSEFKLGSQIISFVENNAHEMGLISRTTDHVGSKLSVARQLCSNAWYSIALHRFGKSYDDGELVVLARRLLESIISFDSIAVAPSGDQLFSGPFCNLDAIVAVTTALTYFGVAEEQARLLRLAISFISRTVVRHTHEDGGFVRTVAAPSIAEVVLDIDCTIDLVRTCLSLLHHIPDRRIWSIARHGLSALFNPSVALARRPETGILLVAGELAEVQSLGTPLVTEA